MATAYRLLRFDSTYGYVAELNTGDIAQAGQFQALGVNGVAFDAGGSQLINVKDPVNPQDGATKHYVDGIAVGISAIPSVRALSNGNVSLSGLQTIDSVALNAGDRVLLTAQTNGVTNGVWIVASGSWSRPTQSDDYTSGSNATGRYVFVEEGTNYASEGWLCTTSGGAVVDTTATRWTQFSGMGEITAGNGLITSAVNGNTVSVSLASPSGLQFTAGALDTLLNGTGGLSKSSSGLQVLLNANSNTIASDASGLRTLGVPTSFTVGGTATSTNVSAANLSALTAGNSSYADSLHNHKLVIAAQATAANATVGVAVSAGDPVYWSSTANTLGRCDNAQGGTSYAIGVAGAAAAANSQAYIIKRGIAAGVLSGATPGTPMYLQPGGGTGPAFPSTGYVVRIGFAVNATDLDVQPQQLLARSSS